MRLSQLLMLVVALFQATDGIAQPPQASPAELIRFLTYQSDRPDKHGIARGFFFSCANEFAEGEEDRPIVEALVKHGDSAIPALETALTSIEKFRQKSRFAFKAGWLFEAYARIRQSAAFPRLRGLRKNPRLAFLQWGLDRSVALSLRLTSYVSASGLLADKVVCGGVLEPRDLLDQLILAWERNDPKWVQASLGPDASSALDSLLSARAWAKMRARLWVRKAHGKVAVGYRFEDLGWWSARDRPLQIDLGARKPANPEINTLFTNDVGAECGRYDVKFRLTGGPRFMCLVNNDDLEGLFRLIASCAEK